MKVRIQFPPVHQLTDFLRPTLELVSGAYFARPGAALCLAEKQRQHRSRASSAPSSYSSWLLLSCQGSDDSCVLRIPMPPPQSRSSGFCSPFSTQCLSFHGNALKIIFPRINPSGTGPNTLESSESCRLSPTSQQCPSGTYICQPSASMSQFSPRGCLTCIIASLPLPGVYLNT